MFNQTFTDKIGLRNRENIHRNIYLHTGVGRTPGGSSQNYMSVRPPTILYLIIQTGRKNLEYIPMQSNIQL